MDRPRRTKLILASWVCSGLFVSWIFCGTPLAAKIIFEHEIPNRVPADDVETREWLVRTGAEIAMLEPESELRSEAGSGESGEIERSRHAAVNILLSKLRSYETALKDFWATRTELATLREGKTVAQLTSEIAEWRSRIENLQSAETVRAPVESEGELEDIEKGWQQANDGLMEKLTRRSERNQRLADAFARQQKVSQSVEDAENVLAEETARMESAKTGGEPEALCKIAELRRRTAQVQLAVYLVREAHVGLEIELDTLALEVDEPAIPVLKELAALLDARREALHAIRLATEIERVRSWVHYVEQHPDAVSAYECLHWPVRLLLIEARRDLRDTVERLALGERFSEERFADLTSDLAGELAIWNQFVSSLGRRSREQIRERYRGLDLRLRDWQRKHAQLRNLFDTTFDQRAQIELRLDELEDMLRGRFRELRDASAQPAGAQSRVGELHQQLSDEKKTFDEELRATRGSLGSLCERLTVANKAVASHRESLGLIRSRLYWSYLFIGDKPLWKFRAPRSSWDFLTERRGQLASVLMRQGEALQEVTAMGWVMLGVVLAGAVGAAIHGRRILFRRADDYAGNAATGSAENDDHLAPLEVRLIYHGMRFVGHAATLCVPALGAWCWAQGTTIHRGVLSMALLILVAAGLIDGLIRITFRPARPDFRLLRCTELAAGHYHRWLRVLWWASIVLLPLPILSCVSDTTFAERPAAVIDKSSISGDGPGLEAQNPLSIWVLYKVVGISIVLAWSSRKTAVLELFGPPERVRHPMLLAIIQSTYPVLYLFGVAMLIAQILGYDALVTYVIFGVASTLGAILLAAFVSRCFSQWQAYLSRPSVEVALESNASANVERALEFAKGREVIAVDLKTSHVFEHPLSVLLGLMRLGIWLGVVLLAIGFWGIGWSEMRGWFNVEVVGSSADRPAITAGRALMAMLVLVFSWIMSRAARSILDSKVYPTYAQLDKGGRVAVNTVLHYMLLLLGLYFGMFLLRIPLGALTVVLGTLGLGLGLASQPLFMNFLSGLIMLFERHVKVGDIVEVDGVLGEVTNISIRATIVKTYDNVDIVIPNSEFVGGKVVNWTLKEPRIRGKVEVGVAYGADPRVVEKLLLQVASESPMVMREPPPRVRFINFGENSLDFVLYVWFHNVSDRWDFITDARFRIVELFDQNKIEIPFPQRTLSLRDDQALRVEVIHPGPTPPTEMRPRVREQTSKTPGPT